MSKKKMSTKQRSRSRHCCRCEHLQYLLAAAIRTYGRSGLSLFLGPEALGSYFAIKVTHPMSDSTLVELVEPDEEHART